MIRRHFLAALLAAVPALRGLMRSTDAPVKMAAHVTLVPEDGWVTVPLTAADMSADHVTVNLHRGRKAYYYWVEHG